MWTWILKKISNFIGVVQWKLQNLELKVATLITIPNDINYEVWNWQNILQYLKMFSFIHLKIWIRICEIHDRCEMKNKFKYKNHHVWIQNLKIIKNLTSLDFTCFYLLDC
jgi:hypothetical protein